MLIGVPIGVARVFLAHHAPIARPPLHRFAAAITVTLSSDGTALHPARTVLFDLSTAPLTVKPIGPTGRMQFVGSSTIHVLGRELA
ncbi:MAG: hypothetical protein OWT27_01400, partial [Firmicutes bacterium]|nr:hypothetical protein [Bacillota bacterium]